MDLALEQARQTIGRTSPNPPVGAVLVRDDRVLAVGQTKPAGGPHAEIVAMRRAEENLRGVTLYTTLEPCCHHGRTGPCTAAIIDAGINRVVIGCRDRNPRVCGQGVETLEEAGLEVEVGVRGQACENLARPFFTWVEKRRPFVVLKAAITMDGRIATRSGDSRWITGEPARARVHGWRDRFDAVLVGAGTVKADNPSLTTRLSGGGGRDPVRIVLDGSFSTDPASRVYRQESKAPTWLVAPLGVDSSRLEAFAHRGSAPLDEGRRERTQEASLARSESLGTTVEPVLMPASGGRVDIARLLNELADREIVSLLVEGGGDVHGAFLASGLFDEVRLFMAPRILGAGPSWASMPADTACNKIFEAIALERPSVETVGDDVLVRTRALGRSDGS